MESADVSSRIDLESDAELIIRLVAEHADGGFGSEAEHLEAGVPGGG